VHRERFEMIPVYAVAPVACTRVGKITFRRGGEEVAVPFVAQKATVVIVVSIARR